MTKSNFEELAKAPQFARPPRADEDASPLAGYGAVRAADGRTARRTGRTVQFATVVSPEFKRWLKTQAAAKDKSMASLLDDMKAAYIEKYGEE
ncbi:MAG: hypothetical protein ACLP7P_05055 [Rhodomicrobium sp.]